MAKAYHEALHPLGNLGIQVSMATLESPHIPAHWHDAMEILFCLNGEVRIHAEQKCIPFIQIQNYICFYVFMLIRSCFPFTVPI